MKIKINGIKCDACGKTQNFEKKADSQIVGWYTLSVTCWAAGTQGKFREYDACSKPCIDKIYDGKFRQR